MKWKRNNSKENGEAGEGVDEETKEESEGSENEQTCREENEPNMVQNWILFVLKQNYLFI